MKKIIIPIKRKSVPKWQKVSDICVNSDISTQAFAQCIHHLKKAKIDVTKFYMIQNHVAYADVAFLLEVGKKKKEINDYLVAYYYENSGKKGFISDIMKLMGFIHLASAYSTFGAIFSDVMSDNPLVNIRMSANAYKLYRKLKEQDDKTDYTLTINSDIVKVYQNGRFVCSSLLGVHGALHALYVVNNKDAFYHAEGCEVWREEL